MVSAASRATSVPVIPHGSTDMSGTESGRIADPFAGHRNNMALRFQYLDEA